MAKIFSKIESERASKHQIGNEFLKCSISFSNNDKSSTEYLNIYVAYDENDEPYIDIIIKEGCRYGLREESKSRKHRVGRYNFHSLRTGKGSRD